MLIDWASSTYLVAPNWKRFWIPGSRLQEEETLYLVSVIVSTSIHPGPLHNQKYTCWETSSIRQIIMHWSHVHRAQSSTKVRFACLSLHLINLWKFKKKRDTDCLSCSIFFTKMMTHDPALFIEHWLPYDDLKMWLDLKLHFALERERSSDQYCELYAIFVLLIYGQVVLR